MGFLKGIVGEAAKTIKDTSADAKIEFDFQQRNINCKKIGDLSNNQGYEVELPNRNLNCWIKNDNGVTTFLVYGIRVYSDYEQVYRLLPSINDYNSEWLGKLVAYFSSLQDCFTLNFAFTTPTSDVNNYCDDLLDIISGFESDEDLLNAGVL